MTVLIAYAALALGVSFVCSLLEATTLSLTDAYIGAMEEAQPRVGKRLKRIKDNVDGPLSAILTLNTVANTIGAVGVGAQVVKIWGDAFLGVASGALTLMILVLSEIIPKSLGAVYWRTLAPRVAYWIAAVTWLLNYPVALLQVVSRLVAPRDQGAQSSREEVMASVQIGEDEGVLHAQEGRIIRNMLRLRQIRVKDIYTPRNVMVALSAEQSIAQAVDENSPLRFSRMPVCGESPDDITGIVHRYRMLRLLSQDRGEETVGSIATPVHAVPDSRTVAGALEDFIQRREHLFLVLDEYGGTAGIVTLEDTIETLLGVEIIDELDNVADMRTWATQLWEQRRQDRQP